MLPGVVFTVPQTPWFVLCWNSFLPSPLLCYKQPIWESEGMVTALEGLLGKHFGVFCRNRRLCKSAECGFSAAQGVVSSLHVRVEKASINVNNEEENEQ